MKRSIAALSLAAAALPLTSCTHGQPVYGGYPVDVLAYDGYYFTYEGYYDNHYGPIFDGYWGTDGRFYFRRDARQRDYRRGGAGHFRKDDEGTPGSPFRRIEGNLRPRHDSRMPHFGGTAGEGSRSPEPRSRP